MSELKSTKPTESTSLWMKLFGCGGSYEEKDKIKSSEFCVYSPQNLSNLPGPLSSPPPQSSIALSVDARIVQKRERTLAIQCVEALANYSAAALYVHKTPRLSTQQQLALDVRSHRRNRNYCRRCRHYSLCRCHGR